MRTFIAILFLLFLTPSLALAGFNEGVLAFKAGEYEVAHRNWLPLANDGHAKAQNNLGILYRRGFGVEQDYVTAAGWYRKAAEQDFAKAQFNLGLLYKRGQGVRKDDVKAAAWYARAAENGYARAQYVIALRYERGNGVEHDPVTALKWLSLCITNSTGKLRKNALKARKRVADSMSAVEIKEAKRQVRAWLTGS